MKKIAKKKTGKGGRPKKPKHLRRDLTMSFVSITHAQRDEIRARAKSCGAKSASAWVIAKLELTAVAE